MRWLRWFFWLHWFLLLRLSTFTTMGHLKPLYLLQQSSRLQLPSLRGQTLPTLRAAPDSRCHYNQSQFLAPVIHCLRFCDEGVSGWQAVLIRVEHFGLQESHASVQAAVWKDQATNVPGHAENTHFRLFIIVIITTDNHQHRHHHHHHHQNFMHSSITSLASSPALDNRGASHESGHVQRHGASGAGGLGRRAPLWVRQRHRRVRIPFHGNLSWLSDD